MDRNGSLVRWFSAVLGAITLALGVGTAQAQAQAQAAKVSPDLLAAVSIDVAPLRQVTYEVELTGRPASSDPPATVATIIEDLGKAFDD